MRKALVIAFFLLTTSLASAQQQQPPDPAFLQQALSVVQTQRNQALDAVAVCQVHSATDLVKANERITQLEKMLAEKQNGG